MTINADLFCILQRQRSIALALLHGFVLAACAMGEHGGDSELRAEDIDERRPSMTLPERRALLDIVNRYDRDDLRSIGLSGTPELEAAAENIYAYRAGPDLEMSSGDDREIDSIQALDDIDFVGAAAFDELLYHVQSEGLDIPFDPFLEASCRGSDTVVRDAFELLEGHGSVVLFDEAVLRFRSRRCDEGTCSDWQAVHCYNGPNGLCEFDGMAATMRVGITAPGDLALDGLLGGKTFGCVLREGAQHDCWFPAESPRFLSSLILRAASLSCMRMETFAVLQNHDGSTRDIHAVLFGAN